MASARSREFWKNYQPPKLPNQDKIEAALERIKNMTPQEVHDLSVKSGIHNEDGTLTAHYGGEDK